MPNAIMASEEKKDDLKISNNPMANAIIKLKMLMPETDGAFLRIYIERKETNAIKIIAPPSTWTSISIT
jgi:hypothetical protein